LIFSVVLTFSDSFLDSSEFATSAVVGTGSGGVGSDNEASFGASSGVSVSALDLAMSAAEGMGGGESFDSGSGL